MQTLTLSRKSIPLFSGMSLIAMLTISGCSGGGSSAESAPAVATVVSGIASKGPVAGGTVTAYPLIAGATGSAIASVQTDAKGAYTLDLGHYSGPLVLSVSGGSYEDEATGATLPLSGILRSALPQASGKVSMNVTAWTEAMYRNAKNKYGGLTPDNIALATADITKQFGFNVVTTRPADPTKPAVSTDTPAQKVYGTYLAVFSQYIADNNPLMTSPADMLSPLITYFSEQLTQYNPALQRADLWGNPSIAAAANSFANSPRNIIGLPTVANIISPSPAADAASLAKTWDQVWNGT